MAFQAARLSGGSWGNSSPARRVWSQRRMGSGMGRPGNSSTGIQRTSWNSPRVRKRSLPSQRSTRKTFPT
jgi:hypothetical protein